MARRRRRSETSSVDDQPAGSRDSKRRKQSRRSHSSGSPSQFDDDSANSLAGSLRATPMMQSGSVLDLLTNTLLLAVPALLVTASIVPSETTSMSGSGLLLVMLWLLLLIVWSARAFLSEKVSIRFSIIDLLIFGMICWQALSVLLLVTGNSGHARPAINMGWEWIGFGVCYFIVRQMFTTYRRQLALLLVMSCLATALASCGLFQYFHTNPAVRRAYENSSEPEKLQLLANAGVENCQPGARDRELFEGRLGSREPLATFILTNSLAGMLVPWMIVVLGFLAVLIRYLRDDESRDTDQGMLLALGVCLALLLGCLILTKSRAAFLAAAVATVMIVFTAFAKSDSMRRVIGYGLGAVLLVFVILAFWVGGLDLEVIAEAPLSIKYRLEYWYATLGMIRENPMFGVGPGNFQDNYMQYMLPQSSEEITDPHNFLLEIASTAGLPALLMFGAAIALWFWRVLPASRQDAEASPDVMQADLDRHDPLGAGGEDVHSPPHNDSLLFCGALIGIGSGVVFSFAASLIVNVQAILVGAVPAFVLAFVFVRYMRAFRSLDSLPLGRWVLAATVAFFVNLLAAGGIGFPGVATSGFVLLALGLNIVSNQATPRTSLDQFHVRDQLTAVNRTRAGALLVGGILLAICCLFTALKPVMQSRPLLAQAERALERRDYATVDDAITKLKRADKHNAAIQEVEMRRDYMAWQGEGYRQSESTAFVASAKEYVRARPRYNGARRQIAAGFVNAYQKTADPQHIRSAVEQLEFARDLRPYDGLLRAQLAWACQAAGDPSQAKIEAEKAAGFDRINKHADRKLAGTDLLPGISTGDELAMSKLNFPTGSAPADAEQWVAALRTMQMPGEFLQDPTIVPTQGTLPTGLPVQPGIPEYRGPATEVRPLRKID